MSESYTPTTHEIRRVFEVGCMWVPGAGSAFDRWLAAYTAEQRHIAWAEGYSWCFADDEPFEGVRSLDDNPYRAPKGATDAKPCKTCGHQPAAHHKLHCESPGCDYCTGWTCREHGLALCGCTYAGGPTPTDHTKED